MLPPLAPLVEVPELLPLLIVVDEPEPLELVFWATATVPTRASEAAPAISSFVFMVLSPLPFGMGANRAQNCQFRANGRLLTHVCEFAVHCSRTASCIRCRRI
jgi:hypothetical protein